MPLSSDFIGVKKKKKKKKENLQLNFRNQNKTLISKTVLSICFLPISKGILIKTFPFKYFSVKFYNGFNA